MGGRIDNPLPKHLAVSFAVAAVLNFIHVIVTVEWSGLSSHRTGARPVAPRHLAANDPRVAHRRRLLVWLLHRNGRRTSALTSGMIALGAALLVFLITCPAICRLAGSASLVNVDFFTADMGDCRNSVLAATHAGPVCCQCWH